jgi:hypothetical protein
MAGFSCDNSQDGFVGEEIYELVYEDIANEEKRLGRDLTIKERNKIYRDNGAPIPTEMYFGPYPEDEDDVEDSPQAATEEQAIEASADQTEENESEDSSQSETIEVPFLEEALSEVEATSPLMAEYWKLAQQTAQKYGVTATLIRRKQVPSTTTKTRFIFLENGSDSKE